MSNRDKYKKYAKQIPIFKDLTPEEVSDILHEGRESFFQQGKAIFHKGQLGRSLFVVFSGSVDIFDGEHKIATCRVGDAFGEMSALDHRPHSATALAATDVRLFTLDEEQIGDMLEQRVAARFLLNVIHVLSGHLANTNSQLSQLERKQRAANAMAGNGSGPIDLCERSHRCARRLAGKALSGRTSYKARPSHC